MTRDTTSHPGLAPAPLPQPVCPPGHRRFWPVLGWAPGSVLVLWGAARVLGVERGLLPVQVMAFTPYAAMVAIGTVIGLVAVAVATGGRQAIGAAVLAAGAALILAGCVLPRGLAGRDAVAAPPGARTLRVLTVNLRCGEAAPAAIVDLVSSQDVDLMAVQEHTQVSERSLAAAGLGRLLPYSHSLPLPRPRVGGSALYSKYPLRERGAREITPDFVQAKATLVMPTGPAVEFESVHTSAPLSHASVRLWNAEFARQRAASPGGPLRVLLGDFNATLDHAALRRLISTGYRDAAATVGAGLVPTWPADRRWFPEITIDHVLADRRIEVHAVTVHRVPGTDHRGVVARLAFPENYLSFAQPSK